MTEKRQGGRLKRWPFCVIILFFFAGSLHAQPWVQTFNPIRTFWVSPNGSGPGTQSNPMSLTTAMNTAAAGDLYWLTAGTYTGQKTFTRAGTSSNPIVWRGVAGGGAIINGSIELATPHNWVWGLEVKDPNTNGTTEGITLTAAGGHVINCIVHDIKGRVGIGAWMAGPGQVVYGNIAYKQIPNGNNPHNLYTQNDYSADGYKYIVGNMLIDAFDATSNTYNLSAYTEGSKISGFHLEKNIFSRGKFVIGGLNLPVDNEIVKQNYFYDSPINFGYARPAQVQFQNNYVGRSTLFSRFFWGKGETQYPQTAQSIFTGNEFHKPSGNHFEFRTSAFIPSQCNGCPEIRSGDSWNNNTYSSPFSATFFADNNDQGGVTYSEWQTFTASAGNAFDTSSTVASTSPNKIAVIPNEYETGRGHVAIFNWTLGSTVSVDLSSILANGANFQVLNPRNMGSPILTGTYTAPVVIPTGGAEFMALLVLTTGTPPPPPSDTTPPETTITSSFCGTTVSTSSVTVNWTGSDNVTPTGSLVYAYALDGGSYSSYGSATSNTFNNLANGSHTVSVKAKDQAGNVDPTPAQCSFTVNVADTTAPVISNITVTGVVLNSATILWDTNEASDSQVEYGTSPCPCSQNSALNTNLTTAHSVVLNGLTAGTTYHYRVKSRDAAGNLAISSDGTFTTGQNPPPPPSGVTTCLEAEAGLLAGVMQSDTDTDASNHSCVESTTQDQGSVSFTLDIEVSGTYVIWARVKARNGNEDSFYVLADGGAEDVFDCAIGTWSDSFQWSRVNGRNGGAPGSLDPRTFNFTAGLHTVVFRGREPKTELDVILVTNNLGYVPSAGSSNSVLYKVKVAPKKFTSSTAKIKWRSEDTANSQVEYGTSTQYGNLSMLDSLMVTKHRVLLENLQPNTLYHYRVRSVDENGNLWISSDFSFTTLP